MLKKDAIAVFGTATKLAQALGIRKQSIAKWPERVPYLRQLQLQQLRPGELVAETIEQRARRATARGRRVEQHAAYTGPDRRQQR